MQRVVKQKKSFWQFLIGVFERGVFAPFLLAIQPAFHLFLINETEMDFSEALRLMFVSLLLGVIVLSLIYLLMRNWLKASAVTSLFIFLFFLFGDLSDWMVATFKLGEIRADFLILALVAGCVILWGWLVQKRIRNVASVNLYFNLLGILLLLKSVLPVGTSLLRSGTSFGREQPVSVAVAKSGASHPDIYYIILDGYGRQDILQALYDFDNSEFLAALRARGFYVAENATSNYVQTLLSLNSSLQMEYLQSLQDSGERLKNRKDLTRLLGKNKVRSILAQNGYQLVSFRNAYMATIPDAEIYYDDSGFAYPLTAFESLAIDRTLLRVLFDVPAIDTAFNQLLIEMPYRTHRHQILSAFARMKNIPALDGNYFVYAHIVAPHPPFVFDAQGDVLPHDEPFRFVDGNNYLKDHSRESYIVGYRNQLQYVNKLVLETVDAILTISETPPIIILQGDHGPGSHMNFGTLSKTLPAERFGILNAYYFPDQDYRALYPSISPVNSFRVLFNQFFDGRYALLPDRHYYSTWKLPFDFTEVTDLSLPQLNQR